MKRYILTGRRGAGKTTFCDTLTNFAKDRGVQLAGLLTFTVRDEGLIVLDLGGGGRKLLAKSAWGGASERKSEGVPQTNRWVFFPDILEWGEPKNSGCRSGGSLHSG